MIELQWIDEYGAAWCLHPPLAMLRRVVRDYPLAWVIA
jgi:hypothetical protein